MRKNIIILIIFFIELHQRSCLDVFSTFLDFLKEDFRLEDTTSVIKHVDIKNLKSLLPEAFMSTMELIDYHGYPGEEHTVTTEDGFVIFVHRIPFGKRNKNENRPPVIVQHGFLCTSSSWLLNLPEQNLPYILAESGYDVWLSNVRGSKYGKQNLHLNQSQLEYWKYSFHEMAVYDLAATVDYILKKTNAEKSFYIGHSMGGTMMFTLLSIKPEYNHKFKRVFPLAPAMYLQRMKSPIYPFLSLIEFYIKLSGINALFTEDILSWIHSIEDSVINTSFFKQSIDIFFNVFGLNPDQMNMSRLSVYFHHFPSTVSAQTYLHFMQFTHTGIFAQYDYGFQENLKRYGQVNPPEYDLSKIDCPVILYSSVSDLAVDRRNVAYLATKIKNLEGDFVVSERDYAHHDFVLALNAKEILYNKIINSMKQK